MSFAMSWWMIGKKGGQFLWSMPTADRDVRIDEYRFRFLQITDTEEVDLLWVSRTRGVHTDVLARDL